MWKIYKITNKIYNEKENCFKSYVGMTLQSIDRRFYEHCNIPGCTAIYSAIKKYGVENFLIEIIHNNIKTEVEALQLETHYIDKYNTLTSNKKGYNICRTTPPRQIIDGKLECRTCDKFKNLDCFSNKKATKLGKNFCCKDCDHQYYLRTIDLHKINEKNYRTKNYDKISKQKKEYRKNNKDKITACNKERFKTNTINNKKLTIYEIYLQTPSMFCTKCKSIRSSNEFYRQNSNNNGLMHICKYCVKINYNNRVKNKKLKS